MSYVMKLRSRITKPEYWANEELDKLGDATSRFYVGLWQLADREGLLLDLPNAITGLLYPHRKEFDVEPMLQALAYKMFIVRYSVDGIKYIWIPGFKRHQKIHLKEAQSVIPLPEEVVSWYNQRITQGKPKVVLGTTFSALPLTSYLLPLDIDSSLREESEQGSDLDKNQKTGQKYSDAEQIRRWNAEEVVEVLKQYKNMQGEKNLFTIAEKIRKIINEDVDVVKYILKRFKSKLQNITPVGRLINTPNGYLAVLVRDARDKGNWGDIKSQAYRESMEAATRSGPVVIGDVLKSLPSKIKPP